MRALVAGAGIAGLTVADGLARGGWDVTVVEQAPGPRGQGYMIDFFGPGYDAAEKTGLLAHLRRRAYDIAEIAWVDERGRTRARLDYGAMRDAVQGRLFSLLRPDVEDALRERLPGTVDVRHGHRLTSFDDDGDTVTVRLAVDGAPGTTRLEADVLVGADGIHSRVRGLLLGTEPESHLRHLGYQTCAYTFVDEALHEHWRGRFAMTDTVDRSVGVYAARGGLVAMFGVHRVDGPGLPDDPREEVARRYAGLGPQIDEILAHRPAADELYYDQVAQVVVPRWGAGRVVLAGDAAGAVSLLAGQGASLAVAGGTLLADRLLRHDVPAAIVSYERELRPVVEERQAAGRRAAGSFVPRDRLGLWTRRAALRGLRVPGLRRALLARLVGKQAELFRA